MIREYVLSPMWRYLCVTKRHRWS